MAEAPSAEKRQGGLRPDRLAAHLTLRRQGVALHALGVDVVVAVEVVGLAGRLPRLPAPEGVDRLRRAGVAPLAVAAQASRAAVAPAAARVHGSPARRRRYPRPRNAA